MADLKLNTPMYSLYNIVAQYNWTIPKMICYLSTALCLMYLDEIQNTGPEKVSFIEKSDGFLEFR